MSDNITHIGDWINKGNYFCPACKYRISGAAWSLAKAEHTCPRCRRRHVHEFRREHK